MPEILTSPNLTINGVICGIYLGENGDEPGIVETWTDKGLEVTVTFICAWSDRIKLLQGLKGSVAWVNDDPTTIKRNHPFTLPMNENDKYPSIEGFEETPYVWARYLCHGTSQFQSIKTRVDQDGSVTGLKGWLHYDAVIIPAHFHSPSYFVGDEKVGYVQGYDLSGYPYTTTTTKTTGEVFAPYTNQFKFETPPAVPMNESNVGIIRPRTEIMVTRHYMPGIDTETFEKLIGKLNKDELVFGTQTYPAGSILYLSYEVEPYGDVCTGTTYCDIKHQLMANGTVIGTDGKPVSSWNYFLRPDGKGWDKLVAVNGGAPPYETADFTKAIWPEF